jgi:hypothetical protein
LGMVHNCLLVPVSLGGYQMARVGFYGQLSGGHGTTIGLCALGWTEPCRGGKEIDREVVKVTTFPFGWLQLVWYSVGGNRVMGFGLGIQMH